MAKSKVDAVYDPVERKTTYTVVIGDDDILGLDLTEKEYDLILESKSPGTPLSTVFVALALIAHKIELKNIMYGDPDEDEPKGLLKP